MNLVKNYFYKTLEIGISNTDTQAVKLKKKSITIVPVLIAPIGFIWSMIYFVLGHNVSASIPLIYTFASVFNLWNFHRTKSIIFIQKMQMALILLLPFALMWSLGGFALSGYVFIWAFFAPITAIIHEKEKNALSWLCAFIVLIFFSTLIDQWLIAYDSTHLPQTAIELFYFINISVALSGIYFLIRYFIEERDKNANETIDDNISYLESYKTNLDNNLIVTRTDKNGIITFANENFYKTSGYTKEEIIGQNHNIVRHPNTCNEIFDELWKTILSKQTWHGNIENLKKDGTSYWVDIAISPILDKNGNFVEFIAIRHNITKLIEYQDELKNMLFTDSLTGLKNRNALQRDMQTSQRLSCVLINIDKFSQINNLYGETFGNKVLIEFSNMLCISATNDFDAKAYRLSGDEFIILTPQSDLETIILNINKLVKQNNSVPMHIDDQEISLSITIGVSLETNDLLLSTANMAIIAARKEFKNITIYTNELSLKSEYANNIKWIKEIKEAIADDRIIMYFQPIVNNLDNSINKYESLIRLIDKDGKVITPYHFLEIAKKAKLYKKLTKIVLTKSFEAFKDNDYDFSINLTIDDILDRDMYHFILDILKKYDISNRVIFEIVESESIENFDRVEEFIKKVKSLGCRISIDDFGTGYSNFEYLMRLQADFIKIDGSIIKEVVTNKNSAIITSVIVAFAKEMNIETIGEFVESKEINDKLISLGVNKSQGYYFDEPQPTLGKKQYNTRISNTSMHHDKKNS